MISLARMLPLAATLFAMMTGGLVMAGMLPDLAADLRVSESVAGQLITAYTIVSALGAPLLATLTAARLRRLVRGTRARDRVGHDREDRIVR